LQQTQSHATFTTEGGKFPLITRKKEILMAFTRDLRPAFRSRYNRVLNLLQVSGRTRIGHVDTGISRHPALGFDDAGNPPENLLLAVAQA
jgi:hypothetical protein